MISRFKGPSFTETEIHMRGRFSKMNLMAKVIIHLQEGKYTQKTLKLAGFMGSGPILSLMALNYTQANGKRAKNMESESLDYLMEAFTEAALKQTNSMALVSSGFPTTPFIKAIMIITKE